MVELKKFIRDIPDFPKKGIIFKDITPLLKDSAAFGEAIDLFVRRYQDKDIDLIVAVEARGFILGGAIASRLGKGIVPVRKKGKLPYLTHSTSYELEYGTNVVEIHQDALERGSRVLVVDDLLATGGTVKAVVDLMKKMGGEIVEIAFLVELTFLEGRKKLEGLPVFSLIKF